MLHEKTNWIKRVVKRAFRVLVAVLMILQTLWIPNSALAADPAYAFQGYGAENMSSTTLSYAINNASVSGRNVTISPLAGEGEAVAHVALNEGVNDISASVDLGGLEVSFSAVSNIALEGDNGVDNDVPTITIHFCSTDDIGSVISSVTLKKQDGTVAGSETLSSGAGIPSGTRSIFVSLKGNSKNGENTVTFSDVSLSIRDAGAPTCTANYNQDWTNQDVTVTINAADSDAGLEGIYVNDLRMTGTSPYTFTVSANNTSFSAYAMDLAGKKSDVVQGTIDHIDKTTPAAPSEVPLSSSNWTNADVFVLMPALSASTGSPERYVYQIGSGAWATLPDGFAITAEGSTTIRVAVEDAAGNRSASAQATAKIDKSAPTIGNAVITSGSSSARVDVSATEVGSSGLEKFCYAAGTQTADYFTTGGTPIVGSTFTVSVGGDYTIFASDYAGNTQLKQISITTAPTFDPISDVSTDEDITAHVTLSVSDAESAVGDLLISVSVAENDVLDRVDLNQTGTEASLDIVPLANVSGGPVTITVDVEDPSGQKVSRSFTVTVNAVNDDPVATDDEVTLSEDGMVEIDVLANDSDTADLDTVSISDVGLAANGTTLLVLGKIRYTPNENFVGLDSFTYTISDGKGGTAEATVSVTVEQVNDAPTAVADTAATAEDAAVNIDVIHNDFDVDKTEGNPDEAIALFSSGDGKHGTTRIVDGMVEYTPEADFNGTDTFTYTIEDLAGLTAQASVTVTVSPEADAPRFSDLETEYTIDEDAVKYEIAFAINDVETPQDSLMLQAATLNEEMIAQTGIEITGLADADPAVKLLMTPVKNQNGDVNIKLTLGDGFDTVEQTITIHINNVNDAPRAGSDTRTYTEDAPFVDLTIASLLSKHSDIDGDTIRFDRLGSDPSVGSIQLLEEEAIVRYIPAKDYDGTTSFTYYITDGTAETLATCTLEAIGVNDTPKITVSDTPIAGTEDTLVVIPFAIEDNESDPGDLSIIVASGDDSIVTTEGVKIINNGDGSGTVEILPQADANGTVNITLTVSDGEAQASDNVDLILAPAQDAPVAEEDLIYVHYTTRRTFSVLTNDHDVDAGDVLTVVPGETTLPGTLTFDEETQMFSYVPALGENGISTFTYTITDGHDTSSALVTLDVISETHAPVITAIDSRYIGEDGTASGIAFAVSDEDVGDTVSISIDSDNPDLLPIDDEHVTLTNLGARNYTLALKPAADQSGSTRVTVTVTDSTELTDSTTFYLVVIGQNDAPVAVDDTFPIDEDNSLNLTPIANDLDADGDTLWLSSLTSAAHGYIENNGRNYVYYPYENWYGTETLTYRVSDGRATDEGTITITVNPVNDAPVAWSDWQTLRNDTGAESVKIPVLSNDYDVDTGDVIHLFQIVTQPSYGKVTMNEDGSITYTRNGTSPLSNGADSFQYQIIDRASEEGDYRSATATVYIGVEFHGSLYTYGKYVSCFEDDEAFTFDISVSNPDNVNYTLTVNTPTTLGVFDVVDNDTVRFTPAPNQYGYAYITYTVATVGGGASDTGTIWLRVYPVNDLPEITYAPASISMNEDTSAGYTFDVNFHDEDCSNRDLYFYVYTQSATSSAPIPFMASYSVSETTGGRQVTVKTAENVNGTGKIVVGVSDGMTYDEAVIDLTVTPVDDAPVVKNVNKTIKEDSSVTFASPGSDSEVDGETITEAIDPEHKPQHGIAIINANRTITYTPNADFYGEDIFNVIVTDNTTAALSTSATVTITVNPVNDAPEIFDLDYYQTVLEDYAKDVTLTVLDVDNDMTASTHYTLKSDNQALVDSDNISIESLGDGQMVIHVVPQANAYGTLKISILASDGSLSAKGAFSLTIVPVNDPPEVADDTASVNEVTSTGAEATPPKTTATINLLGNDSDVEDGKPRIVAITEIPAGVTVTNKGDGTVLVTVDGDYSGPVTFSYTVMDRAGAYGYGDVTLTVNAVNDPPRAKNESVTIFEDETKLIDVLSNDSDPEGNALTILSVGESSGAPAHGTAVIDGTKVSYTPDNDYYGTDSFTYTISDVNGGTATATVSVTIKPVNDYPTVEKHSSNADAWVMMEDETKSFHFVVADAESATSNLIIKITSSEQTLVKNTQIALSTNEAGYKTLQITPVANAHGDLTLTIWVSDGLLSAQAVIPLSILSVNDAPVVLAPAQTTKEDTGLTASATATDADGDLVKFALDLAPLHGTVTVHENGTYDYMPALDYNGVDHFIIVADDAQPSNNLGYATVYITVKPDGDAPVAQDDTITINEDIATTIPVLDNDTDQDVANGDVITILRTTTPAHGTTEIKTDGILYTPKSDFNGEDSFQYTITDKDGKLDTASVTVTINPVNDVPRNGDDTATVLEDHSVDIDVTLNDDVDETTNPDIEDVTIQSVDKPLHGTASYDTNRKIITYTPDPDWFSPEGEPEVFYYTAKDSADQTARFAVSVTVTPVNDLPIITPETLDEVSTAEDTLSSAITFKVSDIETAAGSLRVTATHLNGVLLPPITVTPDAEGNCSFTVKPNENKVGSTTITVKVEDLDGGQDTASFLFTVTGVNDAPRPGNDSFTVSENGTYTADVLANDDVDKFSGNGGDTLTLLSVDTPEFGSATIVNNKLYYVPKADRDTADNYQVVFSYTMKDASGSECSPTVTVTVTPENDAPKISTIADVTGVSEDAANGTGDVSFTVTDEEDDDDTLSVSIACDNTTLFPLSNITVTNPTGDETGSLRTVKAIPAANQFGTATITLTVRDHDGATSSTSFDVTVDSVNDVPLNGDKSFTVVEDVEKQLDVLKDIDPDYATTPEYITITGIADNPDHGTVRIAEDKKSIYYTTAQDSIVPDEFQYTIRDAYDMSDYTFTVDITVTPVNDAPVIHYSGPAEYTVYQGTPQMNIPFTVTDVDNVTFAGGTEDVEVTLSAKSSNSILLYNGIHIDTLEGDNRDIDLQPYLKWNGRTTVTITATDPAGLTGKASFVLIVNNVNDIPVAVNDTGTIPEDQTSSINVLVNDTDDDLQTNRDTEFIKINSVIDADPNATITKSADGLSVTVVPNANYNGPVSFTYDIIDSQDAVSETKATVNLTVSQVNDKPVTQDDTTTTDEGTAVDIYVLGNDSDVDMQSGLNAHPELESLSIVLLTDKSTHGTITTNGAKITYTPNTDYNGPDSFVYYCSDGDTSTEGNVSLTVYQVNDAPVAVANTVTTPEDTPTGLVDVLGNDLDVDTDVTKNLNQLHYKSEFYIVSATLTNSAHGTVEIISNKLKFTPALNWNGSEVVNYTMSDGHDLTATSKLTVTVSPVNDPPVFDTAPEDLTLSEDGADGVTTIVVSDVETAAGSLVVTTTNSTNPTLIATSDVVITGTGGTRTVTVNPKNDQNGTALITLTLSDGNKSTTKSFTVTVTPVNDPPVAIDKIVSINEDAELQTYTKASLASDVDALTNTDSIKLTITKGASHGTASIDTNGNVTYVPTANFNGTDSFEYTATDDAEATDVGTFTITIGQVNDAPTPANDLEKTTKEDTAIDLFVLANDTDIDQDEDLNAVPGAEKLSVVIGVEGLVAPSHGDISTDGTKITYTPDDNYNGADTFEYYCSDGDVMVKAKVEIAITQVDDDPAGTPDEVTINEDSATGYIDVLANDTDIDLDKDLNLGTLHSSETFTITSARVMGESCGTVEVLDNKVKFTPNADWNGTATIFYTFDDGYGLFATTALRVYVTSINDLPEYTTAPIDLELLEDGVDSMDIVVGDVETVKDELVVTVTDTNNPTLIDLTDVTVKSGENGLRTITVNPKENQNGTAVIELTLKDKDGGVTTDEFTVTVLPDNDAPVVIDKTLNIDEDASLMTFDKALLASDVDIATNGDIIKLTITKEASHGTAAIDVNGNVTYIPNADFNGTDSFEYTATDDAKATDVGTFTFTIGQVNDAPTPADDLEKTTKEDTAIDLFVLANDTDIDQDEELNAVPGAEKLSVVIGVEGKGLMEPSHGDISTDGTKITYTPDDNYNGADTFEYYCSDGDVMVKAKVKIAITQVNDGPDAVADEATTKEDTPTGWIDVLVNDTDVDLDPTLNEDNLLLRENFNIPWASVTEAYKGTVQIQDNMLKFTPAANFNGTAVVNYKVDDGYGGSNITALVITVEAVNDLPEYTTAPIDLELSEDGSVGKMDIVVDDVETAKSELVVTVTDTNNPTLIDLTDVTVESGANGLRTITVDPKNNQNGTAIIELTLTDKDGGVTTEEFTVTVLSVNDDPVVIDKTLEIDEDASLMTFDKALLASDVDIATNGDKLTLTITKEASHGKAEIDVNGNVTYVPTANFNGTDSFEYTATDDAKATDVGTFTFTIGQVNDAPTPADDLEKTTKEDTAIDLFVLANDTDIDQDEDLNASPGAEKLSVVIGVEGLVKPTHGDISTDGTKITYSPDDNYNGADTFEYYCSDGDVMVKAKVEIAITQVNDGPDAVADEATTKEDTPTGWIDVLVNDTDVDLDPTLNEDNLLLRENFNIPWASVTEAYKGTVQIQDNMLKFTPAANFNGTAVVNYKVDDGYGGSNITALVITVEAVNDLPEYTTAPIDLELSEDGSVGKMDIVVDDVETAKSELVVTVTDTNNPTLIDLTDVTVESGANGLRAITVDPKNNQNGTAIIELTLTDKDGGVTTEEFTVTVLSVNDAPVVIDKTLNIDEDASLMTFDKALLASDVDIATNGDTIKLTITKEASHGTATIDVNGNVTYIPTANFNGTDSFEYTATDDAKATDVGTFTITIGQVNDAPTPANDLEKTTKEDTAIDLFVLANDTDIDQDEELNAVPGAEKLSVVIGVEGLVMPTHGDISTDGTKITYTPDDNYNGADTFEYYCSDGDVMVKAKVEITITQVNDNPIANDDSAETDEDTAVSFDVLYNDTDVDTLSKLNQDVLHDEADFFIDSITLYGGDNGTATIDGAFIRFTPIANFYGTQIIKYVLKDGHGGTSTGTLTILVGSEFDSPDAVDDAMSAEEDHTASVNVLTNDTDNDPGDTKTFVAFVELPDVLEGTFDTNENGDVSFTPNENYNGSFEATYQVRDSAGLLDTAKLTVTITPVNDVPVANDGTAETDEDNAKDIDVSSLIGDVDVLTNDDVITVSVTEAGEPAHGTVQVSGTTITYTPDKDFNGADEITYTVTDQAGESDTGKLTITIHAVNDAPIAVDDTKTVAEDTATEIFVLANDSDIDTDSDLNLTPADATYIWSAIEGAHGTLTTDGNTIIYTPHKNYNGADTIQYVLTDGIEIVTASVNITITQVNDGIIANDDEDETNDEDPVTVDVLANDTDVDTDSALNEYELHLRSSFRITAVGEPENGAASIVSGKIEYTPDDRFAGTDSFTYTVSDGHGETATGNVTVTVHSVNDPPVILKVSSPKDGDRAGTGSTVLVEWTSFDIDGDALTYRLEYFDGKDWLLVSDKLTDTKYLFAIPSSLGSVDGLKFRVNASDSEFTSDYGYSGAMKVDQDAPKGTIVTMKTADGRTYTAGTWTNQTVTVIASNSVDDSKVVYYYGMDARVDLQTNRVVNAVRTGVQALGSTVSAVKGSALTPADSMDVVTGVHYVHITAVDEYGNETYVGSYLARVDKQQPAVPDIRESISGGNVVLTLTMNADPGNSGNDKLTLPDNSVVKATGNPAYSTPKNGTYNFSLVDVAGNRRSFSYTVTTADTSKPVITLDAGDYRIGSKSLSSIKATLSFTDAESEITNRGYVITAGSTPSGAYRTYDGALTLSDPGTYYIHAYAKNAFGLTTYETFGPFIIEAPEAPADTATPSPTPAPTTGDVVIGKEDVEEIPGDTVSIRIPGHEWSETLTLEDVGPGVYLIEAMDADGNIRTVEVRVTMRDIIARSLRSNADNVTTAAIVVVSVMALCAILLLALLAGHNITIVVNGSEKKLRTFRRIKFKKKELVIDLNEKQLTGGTACSITIAKSLSKSMRGNVVIVSMRGIEALREQIPENFDEAFKRTIRIAD